MKITILNGNPEPSSFDGYLDQLVSALKQDGHAITRLDLRDLLLRYCIGCWGCWVKTPGQCSNRDASIEMDRSIIQSDFTLWASPLKMGFPSRLLKMALDKHLPLIHPYMVVDHNEAHHLKRYPRYPRVGLLVEKEADTDTGDLSLITDIFARTALNFKSRLEFVYTTEQGVESLARQISIPNNGKHLFIPAPGALPGMQITPPKSLAVFNGSPRGRKGNTPILLGEFIKGFGHPAEMYHLNRLHDTELFVQAFAAAECAWIGFPLYTDAMPGIVKHFIEALEPLHGRKGNPPLGFLVQSGFPEAIHSRHIERYLEKLASRLGCTYLGTIVKGGGEGLRVMPPEYTRGLFTSVQALGRGLASTGQLDAEFLRQVAKPERFSPLLWPFFQVFLRLPMATSYFDQMLRQNGVYDQRYATPFLGKK
ncbi:MAG: NAD(P)H-dependent oxidoreductase [Anaerolineales bacterium]|nr:NAD(P)H-dependent oxidoreductase [Anaerolineales bacterium]